jgi:hypothetical protein
MNRGIAKRLMFAGRRDRRQFLYELARAFRRSQLIVEAYSLLGTHYHLLVRTAEGTLSEGMRRVQNGFSRWFNRRNRRDGGLVRGRFRSRPVTSKAHLFATLPYLDFNPIKAKLCKSPTDWEAGSARHYASGEYPRWLTPVGIHAALAPHQRPGETLPATYARLFSSGPSPLETKLIEARFNSPAGMGDDLDYLLEASGESALRWIEAKARNADGLRPACALLPAEAIEAAAESLREPIGELRVKRSRKDWDAWPLLIFGLQNAMAGLGGAGLAMRHAVSGSTAGRYVQAHRQLVGENQEYAEACQLVAKRALELTYARARIS